MGREEVIPVVPPKFIVKNEKNELEDNALCAD